MSDIRLNSSKLGTEDYWNQFYQREINNFESNEEDTGECWFDDSDAELKMIEFLIDKINQGEIPMKSKLSFLDIGTGNGHLLFQMYDDFQQELEADVDYEFMGMDYSPDSVNFAGKICERKYNGINKFQFAQADILQKQNHFLTTYQNKFDILLDKGTLDAIALNQDPLPDFDGKIGMDIYGSQISQLMHKDSILLITSCNFTQEELIRIITTDTQLKVWDQINYPSFEFGGHKGSTICSIAFIKE